MLMAGKGLIGKLIGLSPKATRWIYEAIVKPTILYGVLVWAHRIPSTFQPLLCLQRLTMMGLGHFLPHTPTIGLQVMLGVTPLDILAAEELSLIHI